VIEGIDAIERIDAIEGIDAIERDWDRIFNLQIQFSISKHPLPSCIQAG
jgi:hypothetical protein